MFSWNCISVVENCHPHRHNIRSGRPKMCPGYIDVITDINKYKIVWMDMWAAVEIFEPHRKAKTKFSNPEILIDTGV